MSALPILYLSLSVFLIILNPGESFRKNELTSIKYRFFSLFKILKDAIMGLKLFFVTLILIGSISFAILEKLSCLK